MKNALLRYFAGLAGVAMVSTALAADTTRSPNLNTRERSQEQRIQQGARSGQLTQEETRKLQAEEKALRTEERAYKSDGKVTPAEQRDLHQDVSRISRDIRRERHDRDLRSRPPRPPTHAPVVNARQHAQQDRIAAGVRSGQLTKPEATQLRQEQQAIRAEERAYKADGKLTIAERKDLHQDVQKASKGIYQEKHDAEARIKPVPATPPAAR